MREFSLFDAAPAPHDVRANLIARLPGMHNQRAAMENANNDIPETFSNVRLRCEPISAGVYRNGFDAKQTGWISQLLLFARNFFRHPDMIGWFLPSSRFVVREVLRQIDWENARVIVEYGPGIGTFTKDILQRMRPDARLIAFETNDEFYNFLKRSLCDPRFHLIHESATEIEPALMWLGLPSADYVISGIPFKTLTDELRAEIVRKTHAILRPEGRFLVYQLSAAIRPHLERVFARVQEDFELFNILPTRLFYCAR